VNRRLTIVDLWSNQIRTVGVARLQGETSCPTCGKRDYPWLDGRRGVAAVSLCGRNSVQLAPAEAARLSLRELASKLQALGSVTVNNYLLRFVVDKYRITVFPDGRTIVGGTDDPAEARVVHARYIGG
jgi:adenylyltransferase/sulfurtransferase